MVEMMEMETGMTRVTGGPTKDLRKLCRRPVNARNGCEAGDGKKSKASQDPTVAHGVVDNQCKEGSASPTSSEC